MENIKTYLKVKKNGVLHSFVPVCLSISTIINSWTMSFVAQGVCPYFI